MRWCVWEHSIHGLWHHATKYNAKKRNIVSMLQTASFRINHSKNANFGLFPNTITELASSCFVCNKWEYGVEKKTFAHVVSILKTHLQAVTNYSRSKAKSCHGTKQEPKSENFSDERNKERTKKKRLLRQHFGVVFTQNNCVFFSSSQIRWKLAGASQKHRIP